VNFARTRGLRLSPNAELDGTFERLANFKFFQADALAELRYAVWGYAWVECFAVTRTNFPRFHASLRGWGAASPERARDPMTWELMLVLMDAMLHTQDFRCKRTARLAGLALAVQWTGYFRPTEVLELSGSDVIVDRSLKGAVAVVARAGPDCEEGSPLDQARAQNAQQRPKPAKNNEFDGTIVIGDQADVDAGRKWVAALLSARKRSVGRKRLFDISLAQYEEVFRWAGAHLQLPANVAVTPHTARHGGASADRATGARDFAAIKARGRWDADRSVARYKKAGMYWRQLSRLPAELRDRAAALLNSMPAEAVRQARLPWPVPDTGCGHIGARSRRGDANGIPCRACELASSPCGRLLLRAARGKDPARKVAVAAVLTFIWSCSRLCSCLFEFSIH